MFNRRKFIKTGLLSSAGVMLLPEFALSEFLKKEIIKLTILHTNDMHSHIEPFPINDPLYPGIGGMARRAALIDEIRAEEENIMLLDAGDVFQGTPYFNMYGGELEFKLMSLMKYDACTIGNHDFDNGVEGLAKMLPHANFPFISSNYDFADTALNGKTIPYKVFEKNSLRVGVYALGVELKGLVDKKNYANTLYLNPVEVAKEKEKMLKQELNCDIVLCLSHLGYKYKSEKVSDVKLAGFLSHTDLIIGGHTHTFLDKAVSVKNANGSEILVTQAGWAGLRLGRVDFVVEKNSRKKLKYFSSAYEISHIKI
jgi:5'-nucleotidase